LKPSLPQFFVLPRPGDHGRTRRNGPTCAVGGGAKVVRRDRLPRALVGETQQVPRQDEPIQRHLVDGQAMLVEVVRAIEVRATVLGHDDHPPLVAHPTAADAPCCRVRFERKESSKVAPRLGIPL
jgi:hypothetical protein